ncbi:sialidase-3-like [Brienomyrus brachyistius]|uniref:sialidase-3-like n=1 Tax=Brienomyrus brachyistius TaxID=42636 RepID=UPI0020B3A520|nr:sialidase-3-like [Brienomyrus brachyistius]XP_048838946.1 sialidase-3-like [Brienomyrus brachyistius]XP_048838947.1 sialidase-3-like [Brienomyrus brachyistius]
MANTTPKAPPEKTMLFQQQRPGGLTYRIPSLTYIKDGDDRIFLAIAEKRSTPCDTDAEILVMRKGKLHLNGTAEWSPIRELSSASLPEHRTMNPCLVREKISETLFLFFICIPKNVSETQQRCRGKNAARLCYISSTDKGEHWSKVTDLTESVIGRQIHRWATFALGPGHGIQLLSNGKLIVPAYVYYIHCKSCCYPCPKYIRPHAFYFYSEDRGETWHISKRVKKNSAECEVAEIIDGSANSHVYCNARSSKGHRVEAFGESNRADFDRCNSARALVEQHHGCQGSVIGFPAQKTDHGSDMQTWLLFSHPTNCKKRKDLGVYVNKKPLCASDWQKPWIICPGPSAYSDLTYCADLGLFACLLECGEKHENEQIAFVSFPLDDVLEATDN